MDLPRNYNRRLQKAYPNLRMRWSDYRECWLLEMKANYGRIDVNPEECTPDTFIQRRDGYCLAGEYTPRGLPPLDRFIPLLRRNDTALMPLGGGPDEAQTQRLERIYLEQEAKVKKDKRAVERDRNYEQADILWDVAHGTTRAQVPANFQQET